MSEEILVNVTPQEVRVARLVDGLLQDILVERHARQGLLGNIYKGRVSRLLPGIQAAFVDVGLDRAGFLHVSDLKGHDKLTDTSHLDIRDKLHVGQDILVQVYKDPLGSKGARLTTNFGIPARYLVFTPGSFQVAISQKITNEVERERLLNLITPSEVGGYIFRTVAEGVTEAAFHKDQAFLHTLWQDIAERAKTAKVGDLIYEEISVVLRVVRDWAGECVEKIRVDDATAVLKMRDFAQRYLPMLEDRIEYYDQDKPIFDMHGVEEELELALQRKVPLKSGGHVVFDQTEAMTTIDVNTGSYVGNDNLAQTIYKTNIEAIEVIARQVRLRNLGGIIIIDFIDMTDATHRAQLLDILGKAMAHDYARTEISELSSLGLVQMTRKRSRESLERVLCASCPLCQRRGYIKSLATISYEIFREIKRLAQFYGWSGFLVVAAENVVEYLMVQEAPMLAALEKQLAKTIELKVGLSLTQEHYNILPRE